jgi:uncharacterized damage-inducible protein DinB
MNPNNARTDILNESAPQGSASLSSTQALTETLLKLVDDSIWSNHKWIDFVFSQAGLETRPRELLGHLMVGERVWFGRIEGGHAVKEMFPVLEKEELVRGFIENRNTYARLMTRLDDVVHFRRGTGEEYHAKVADIFHHLITHGYHHRGQLAMYFGQKGVTDYPKTDHIYFLLENKL